MRFVAIEYKDGTNNNNVLGYMRIPENMPPIWTYGYRAYLRDKKKVTGINVVGKIELKDDGRNRFKKKK